MMRSVLVSMVAFFSSSDLATCRRSIFGVLVANDAKREARCSRSQLFLPVTSSHLSPSSFLIASTFFDASSFISTNTARAAA